MIFNIIIYIYNYLSAASALVLRPLGFGVDWDWVGGPGVRGSGWTGPAGGAPGRTLLSIHFLSALLFTVISLFIFIIKREKAFNILL
jgi:hypothetical protein